MKKFTFILMLLFFVNPTKSFTKNNFDPIRQIQIQEINWTIDNPKGKFKIRFIRNQDKSDTTNRAKGFFGRLKNIVDMLLDVSDNPPFKVEIVREKEKKN